MVETMARSSDTSSTESCRVAQFDPLATINFCCLVGNRLPLTDITTEKVNDLWKKVVDDKDPAAMVELGVFYMHGSGGVFKNLQQAFTLFNDAADLGYSEAIIYQLWIALAAKDKGVQADAVHRVRQAADRNIPEALLVLGMLYKEDVAGLKRDNEKGEKLCFQAASMGDSLAMIYQGNKLKDTNFDEAEMLCSEAVAKGNSNGYYALAVLYHSRDDRARYIEHLQKGVAVGDLACMRSLAIEYERGCGDTLPQNLDKAIELHQRCADFGDPIAMSLLGDLYKQKGHLEVALEWYKKSITSVRGCFTPLPRNRKRRGFFSQVMLKIARFYIHGYGTNRADMKRCQKWVTRSAELGDIGAMSWLAKVFEISNGRTRDVREAFRWKKLSEGVSRP